MGWYNKLRSEIEVIVTGRKPDTGNFPEDKPAGAYARIQRRRWKLWVVLDNYFNPTKANRLFVRAGIKNEWVEFIPNRLPVLNPVVQISTSQTLSTLSQVYECTNGTPITLTLGTGSNGQTILIKKTGAGNVTISALIDSGSSLTISVTNDSRTLISNGTKWLIY